MYKLNYQQQVALTLLAVELFGQQDFERINTQITQVGDQIVANLSKDHKAFNYTWVNGTWLIVSEANLPPASPAPYRPPVLDDRFPIMGEKISTRVGYVPFSYLAKYEANAKHNHNQTLARLKERGGLDPTEALWIVEGYGWNGRKYGTHAEAWERLKSFVNIATGDSWDFATGTYLPKPQQTLQIQVKGPAGSGKNTLLLIIHQALMAKGFDNVKVDWGDTTRDHTARNHDLKVEAIRTHEIHLLQIQAPRHSPFLTPLQPGLPPNPHSILNKTDPEGAPDVTEK